MKDEKVKLFAKQQYHPMNHEFRLIQVRRIDDGKKLCFLTNRFDLSASEISDIYKKRWEIEVFFKFIKQNLNAKHFLSHSLNGIKVTFYMILILSLILMIYKMINKIKSYQDTIFFFKEEIKLEIYKIVAIICSGDPNKLDIFSSS